MYFLWNRFYSHQNINLKKPHEVLILLNSYTKTSCQTFFVLHSIQRYSKLYDLCVFHDKIHPAFLSCINLTITEKTQSDLVQNVIA